MKTAVISGGAGGLGRALSDGLRASGWRVVAIDRDISALEEDETLFAVECDLTDQAQRDRVLAELAAACPEIDLVIYNAGITQIGDFETLAEDTHRRVFEINYFAAIEMARVLLPNVRAARGAHLAISSVAGFAPLYRRVAYAGSKHALEGFFKSLASEEAAHGVRVQIAAPSFVATNIGNPEQGADGIARPGSAPDGIDYMEPDVAARIILRGVERGAPFIPVGRVARAAWWINGLSPRLFRWLMERKIRGR
ncbi:SDR family NAD(P)-dependent oxidoreductase [Marimonas lutisalis]|uniref:SDR family NAD(P)-dependent oxidoreductase n=1 Tax=Marimonas lutisalis TaxID=2545756 RepID=UPI0010F917CA|nr:SDR family NAD(P)-dependent oxidoreductase [Marimonas lutisalis]